MSDARTLLRDLRLLGVRLAATDGRLRFDAPKGVLTPQVQNVLRTVKSEALEAIQREERLLDLTVSEFGGQKNSIEVRVAFLDETLWIVPNVSHIAPLMASGVNRGRIWTAGELGDLFLLSPEPKKDFERVARLRTAFGAEIVSIGPDAGASTRHA